MLSCGGEVVGGCLVQRLVDGFGGSCGGVGELISSLHLGEVFNAFSGLRQFRLQWQPDYIALLSRRAAVVTAVARIGWSLKVGVLTDVVALVGASTLSCQGTDRCWS